MEKTIREKILSGEIDINNQQNFFKTVIKGFLFDINKYISIRGEKVPHYILSTGDAEMYVELMGNGYSDDVCDMPSDSFVYTQVPRCIVQPKGVNIETDQLSNPYTRMHFDLEHDNQVYGLTAEARRMPIKMEFELKYYMKTMTDCFELAQQVTTNWMFLKNFFILYMGQSIECSYKIPETLDTEYSVDFDFSSTELRDRTLSLSIELQTNLPVYDYRTVVENSAMIRNAAGIIKPEHDNPTYAIVGDKEEIKKFLSKEENNKSNSKY